MRFFLSFVLVSLSFSVLAAEPDLRTIREKLKNKFPGMSVEGVSKSPVPGLYEIEMGSQIAYISEDGRYLVVGHIIDVESRANLTEKRQQRVLKRIIANLNEKEMIIIGPKKAVRTLTIFTDVDCPYCARLHQDVPTLNKHGVKIRYLLYPRNGLKSSTYKKSVAVWCAKDRIKAIGLAKAGKKIAMKTCKNPVAAHYKLGQKIGIRGTPAIVVDDGRLIGGYVPAAKLLSMLGISTKK